MNMTDSNSEKNTQQTNENNVIGNIMENNTVNPEIQEEDPDKIFSRAGDLWDENKFSEAFDLYIKGYDIALMHGDKSLASDFAKEIGDMYLEGLGVEKDYEKTAEWYRKVETPLALNAEDLMNLGKIFEEGKLVKQDYETAAYLYSRIEEEARVFNDSFGIKGLVRLEEMYRKGIGIQQDLDKALYYSNLLVRSKYCALGRQNAFCPGHSPQLEDFKSYYNSDFSRNMIGYFKISRYGKENFPLIMKCYDYRKYEYRKDMFDSAQKFFFFAAAVMYTHIFPYAVKRVCGDEAYHDMLRATGWPEICCGMAGVADPVYTMQLSGFLPTDKHVNYNLAVIDATSEYMLKDFKSFLGGYTETLDVEAYDRLLASENFDTKAILRECEKYINAYKTFMQNPGEKINCEVLFRTYADVMNAR